MLKKSPPLKLSVKREPVREHSFSAVRIFEATLSTDHNGPPYDNQWLRLSFVMELTGLKASRFDTAIYPRHFAQVAQMMVDADPVAAIRAFGAAMQTAGIERDQTPVDDDVAA